MVLGTPGRAGRHRERAQMAALISGFIFIIAQAIGMGMARPWEAPLQDFAYLPACPLICCGPGRPGSRSARRSPTSQIAACCPVSAGLDHRSGRPGHRAFPQPGFVPGIAPENPGNPGKKAPFGLVCFFALSPPFWYGLSLESWRPFCWPWGPFQNTRKWGFRVRIRGSELGIWQQRG